MPEMTPELSIATTNLCKSNMLAFAQSLVRTPGLSGDEEAVARLVAAEMKTLGYQDVAFDEVGNVSGTIAGRGGPVVMLNGHIDTVDPGPESGWKYPAYGGDVIDGYLWGRGSVDMKGPVAAMIYGIANFPGNNIVPPGDILVTTTVSEEISGLGADFMASRFQSGSASPNPDAVIVVEPSNCNLRLGHRGRMELQVRFPGRSAHASVPHLGTNPHFAAAEFLRRLDDLPLDRDPVLGRSTIAPTLYHTDQVSANVIPGEVIVFLDWRNVPPETEAVAIARIESLLEQCHVSLVENTDAAFSSLPQKPTVEVTRQIRPTWPGANREFASIFPPFSTSAHSPIAIAAAGVIDRMTDGQSRSDVWQFATDGGHWAAAGMPVVGFGPGDDALAHTQMERLELRQLDIAAATYAPLASAISKSMIDESP